MTRALETVLDEANPNKMDSAQQLLKAGQAYGQIAMFKSGAVTSNKMALPEGQKATQITRAYSRAGTLTGYLTPVAPETVPTTGQVAVNANGDIVTAAADAVTQLEVEYIPVEGQILEDTVAVAASVATLPQSRRGQVLVSVSVVTGVIPGAKTVVARGTAAPTAGNCALSVLGTTVVFNAADVVAGTALIRYAAVPGVGSGVEDTIANKLLSQVAL